MDRQLVARRLKNLRKGRPMAEVASAVGIGVSSLGMYETGARMPRDEVKLSLAKFYGRSVNDIFLLHEFT